MGLVCIFATQATAFSACISSFATFVLRIVTKRRQSRYHHPRRITLCLPTFMALCLVLRDVYSALGYHSTVLENSLTATKTLPLPPSVPIEGDHVPMSVTGILLGAAIVSLYAVLVAKGFVADHTRTLRSTFSFTDAFLTIVVRPVTRKIYRFAWRTVTRLVTGRPIQLWVFRSPINRKDMAQNAVRAMGNVVYAAVSLIVPNCMPLTYAPLMAVYEPLIKPLVPLPLLSLLSPVLDRIDVRDIVYDALIKQTLLFI
ncbi:hypothetical protein CYLTODRAFT_279937 [Cylindrobasidium torrendii FP15055 ss-10]|uniref:Uncharacterized protein n=1 Tax=Cylindrobasidium torrendii FP15055 ss-10 TaxID=1314674 RepID=A0A0D7BC72_9AGAR|nr:hypothetical protein CYLTODRAFT_279937 [Cylindrobasidium torrendii FP15055 ss-10]